MSEIRPRALACLREGRVAVTLAEHDGERIQASVTSSRPERTVPYIVDRWPQDSSWSCTCRPGDAAQTSCAHIAAVQLVTGYTSAAARRAS